MKEVTLHSKYARLQHKTRDDPRVLTSPWTVYHLLVSFRINYKWLTHLLSTRLLTQREKGGGGCFFSFQEVSYYFKEKWKIIDDKMIRPPNSTDTLDFKTKDIKD